MNTLDGPAGFRKAPYGDNDYTCITTSTPASGRVYGRDPAEHKFLVQTVEIARHDD